MLAITTTAIMATAAQPILLNRVLNVSRSLEFGGVVGI